MYFDSIDAFLSMGGYGFYVWLSFGVGFFCLAVLWISSFSTKRNLFKQVMSEQARQARIQAARVATPSPEVTEK